MTLDDLLDAWRTNCAVNRLLLEMCPDEAFEAKPGKGKTIRSNWVHLILIRRAHVEDKLRSEAGRIAKLDWKEASREEIAAGLAASDVVMEEVFRRLEERPNRWTAAKFFGYEVAHEAHHRSQIEIALRLGGFEPPDARLYELWNWTKL